MPLGSQRGFPIFLEAHSQEVAGQESNLNEVQVLSVMFTISDWA